MGIGRWSFDGVMERDVFFFFPLSIFIENLARNHCEAKAFVFES